MKARKFTVAVSALLLLTLLLSSCGASALSFKKVFTEPYVEQNPTRNALEQLSYRGIVDSYSDNLLVFCETDATSGYNTYFIYHLGLGKSLLSVSETATLSAEIETRSIGNLSFFWVTTHNTVNDASVYQTALYDQSGTLIAQKSGSYNIVSSVDLIFFDDDVYRISEDGTIAKAFSWSDLSSRATDLDYMTENYYYAFDRDGFSVYDKSLTPVCSHTIPEYAKTASGFFLLDSGDILYQVVTPLPADAQEFDLFIPDEEEGGKYLLSTILFNVKKQQEKELKLPYLIDGLVCKATLGFPFDPSDVPGLKLGDSMKNIGVVYEIKDGYVSMNDEDAIIASLSNRGKIVGTLNGMFSDMLGLPEQIKEGYYLYSDTFNRDYLLNDKGELVGEISAVVRRNQTYLATENKIYTYDLSVAFDLTANKMSVLYSLNNAFLLTDEEGKVYLFDAQKSLTEIADRDYGYGGYYDEEATRAICYKSTSLFGVESYADGERMFYYYNANGTLLYTSNVELSLVTHSGDGRPSLYTGFNGDGERIYVRFYAS